MSHPRTIFIVDRFAPLRSQLLTLLANLSEEEWNRPTAAARWSVKDVTAHLLGGDLGILSRERDGFRPPAVLSSYEDLVCCPGNTIT
jgi:uncharacterized damage-inducible protein DinB